MLMLDASNNVDSVAQYLEQICQLKIMNLEFNSHTESQQFQDLLNIFRGAYVTLSIH